MNLRVYVYSCLLVFGVSFNLLSAEEFNPLDLRSLFKPLPKPAPARPFQYTVSKDHEEDSPEKLFKVFALGDSLLQNFHTCSEFCIAQQILFPKKSHAFIDTNQAQTSVDSLFEKLSRQKPTLAMNFGNAGSGVIVQYGDSPMQRLLHIRKMSEQISEIKKLAYAPDLSIVWLGHNDVNLFGGFSVEYIRDEFFKEYREQLLRLVSFVAIKQPSVKKAILVLGLGDFNKVFKARDECEDRRKLAPELYPNFEAGFRDFPALLPKNRTLAVKISKILNVRIEEVVTDLNFYRDRFPNVDLRYSDAMANAGEVTCDDLSAFDAYHPSVQGQQKIANSLYEEVSKFDL